MYKFYSKQCGMYSEEEKDKINVRYYESSSFGDKDDIIKTYNLINKTGKEIQSIICKENIQFEKLLKLCSIYHDWYLYSENQVIGTCISLI